MTRSELVRTICELNPRYTLGDVSAVVENIINFMIKQLACGGRVELRGFGSFSVKCYQEKIGRNPKTGQPVILGKRGVVYFRPGREIRDRINHKEFL